jgi:hypothetical protein
MNTNELKTGDRVAYNTSRNYVMLQYDNVERTTKTQIVLMNGKRFNREGTELKSDACSYPSARLWDLEDADAHEARRMHDRELRTAIDDLTSAIANKRCGSGNYFLDADTLAAIQQLTSMIKNQS